MANDSKICLTLVCGTLAEDIALARRYSSLADIVELRADHLDPSERGGIRSFQQAAGIPAILTVRRRRDGGVFDGGEDARRALLASNLGAFSYVDLESDLDAPELAAAAARSGTRVIRSLHRFEPGAPSDAARVDAFCQSASEIPKLAFMPRSPADVAELRDICLRHPGRDRIFCAMGPFGTATRILPWAFKSFLTFVSAPESAGATASLGHVDIATVHSVYSFRTLGPGTSIRAVTGWPLAVTASPQIHREFCRQDGTDSVMIPIPSENVADAVVLAESLGADGLAVTVPHKRAIMPLLDSISDEARAVGAVNTVVWRDGARLGFNTDVPGFSRAVTAFAGDGGIAGMKTAIVGSGGAARAVARALAGLGADAVVYARNESSRSQVAEMAGLRHAPLEDIASAGVFDLIVQCTSVGNGSDDPADDPIPGYRFAGSELVYDLIYKPVRTPLLKRAEAAGCRVENGMSMLVAQGRVQHELWRRG